MTIRGLKKARHNFSLDSICIFEWHKSLFVSRSYHTAHNFFLLHSKEKNSLSWEGPGSCTFFAKVPTVATALSRFKCRLTLPRYGQCLHSYRSVATRHFFLMSSQVVQVRCCALETKVKSFHQEDVERYLPYFWQDGRNLTVSVNNHKLDITLNQWRVRALEGHTTCHCDWV